MCLKNMEITTPSQPKDTVPLIGQSKVILRVFELIKKVADNDSTLLILGESGTGKEVVAKASHFLSSRANKPFIPINCGAIPEALLESELFGHERGAFTGANNIRQGRFELAHTGTIFLDEISEMPYPLQVKLLRAIQEREFERVGGSKSIKVDVRIIAAANVDLEEAVLEKRFRKDLFYRLNVIPINLPPLRERQGDIPIFIAHFIDRFNRKKQKAITGLSKEASEILERYSWPGNIRELENIIERMVILANGATIGLDDLPERIVSMANSQSPPQTARTEPLAYQLNAVSMEEKADLFSPVMTMPIGITNEPSSQFAPDLLRPEESLPNKKPVIPPDELALFSQPQIEAVHWPMGLFPLAIPDEGVYFVEIVEAFENRLIDEALKKANGVKSRAAQLLHLNRTTLVEKLKRSKKDEGHVSSLSDGDPMPIPQSMTPSSNG